MFEDFIQSLGKLRFAEACRILSVRICAHGTDTLDMSRVYP